MPTSYPFWLGGVAASMAASFTHPLDLAKVRMQTTETVPGTKRLSTFVVIRQTITNSGISGLYTGLSASLMRQMSYSLVRLGAYENIKGRINNPSASELLVAAAFAGACGAWAGNWADILLVRMITDTLRPPETRYGYANALTGAISLLRQEGMAGFFRGLTPNTVRAVLMNTSQVGSYDLFKATLLRHPIFGYQLQDNLLLHSISSGLAGAFATTVCSPADVVKSRIMSSSAKHGIIQVLGTSLREEGVSFLFKGWFPAFLRLGPNTVLLFVFFEQLKKRWNPSTS